jgi:hypothetical protein
MPQYSSHVYKWKTYRDPQNKTQKHLERESVVWTPGATIVISVRARVIVTIFVAIRLVIGIVTSTPAPLSPLLRLELTRHHTILARRTHQRRAVVTLKSMVCAVLSILSSRLRGFVGFRGRRADATPALYALHLEREAARLGVVEREGKWLEGVLAFPGLVVDVVWFVA